MSDRRKKNIRRECIQDILIVTAVLILVGWFSHLSARGTTYSWQWYQVPKYFFPNAPESYSIGPILQGLAVTLQISVLGLLFSLMIGLVTSLLRLSGSPAGRLIARLYLELSRNTPLLIQIFFIYFVVGPALGLNRFSAAVVSLSLFEGAYASEIFRSGILSVPHEQIEAAYSIGLTPLQTFRHIILPQALRTMLPPLTSQMVSLIKDSSLVSTIAIYDLTMQAQAIVAETYLTFEIWFTVAIIYLIVTGSVSLLAAYLERRLKTY